MQLLITVDPGAGKLTLPYTYNPLMNVVDCSGDLLHNQYIATHNCSLMQAMVLKSSTQLISTDLVLENSHYFYIMYIHYNALLYTLM